MSLDELLRKHFGCNKAFLKERRAVRRVVCGEPEPEYEYMTRVGRKAYNKLVTLLYELELLLGHGFDASKYIDELDGIVNNNW